VYNRLGAKPEKAAFESKIWSNVNIEGFFSGYEEVATVANKCKKSCLPKM
jgi:hypothetical protein